MHRILFVLSVLGLSSACTGSAPPQTPDPSPTAAPAVAAPVPAGPQADQEAMLRAKEAATTLKVTLKGRLVKAMGEGGAQAAASVCREEAQALTAKVAADTKVRVGRASLKLRNPANQGPDWVEAWLVEQQGRTAAEASALEAFVDTPDGRVARYVEPLPVGAPCLACHGPADQLADGVSALLAEHYADDAATGYAAGDLRGAVWAEAGVAMGVAAPDGPAVPEG